MTEKHWTYMTDEEIGQLRDSSWKDDPKDGALIRGVCKEMRRMTVAQYRRYLMDADRERSRA